MQTTAVVEISGEMDARAQARLIASAYRWSRSGLVMLALRNVSRQAVDRLLNPVVAEVGLDVHGIQYLDAADAAEVLRYVAPGTLVVAGTEAFRARLLACGVPVVREDEALARMQDCTRPLAAPASLSAA